MAPSTCNYAMTKQVSSLYWDMLGILDGNVLDVASGMGGFGLSKPDNVNLYGIERDKAIALNSINYKELAILDLEKMKEFPFNGLSFDGVLARDILEHLNRPWDLLDLLFNNMNSGATFVCSVPKPDPRVVWNDYTHVRGFTKKALNDLLLNSGFEVEKIFPMSGFSVASKLGITKHLPYIGKIPIINKFMVSYNAIAYKP
jgi:SAM-dependent methyltransferase